MNKKLAAVVCTEVKNYASPCINSKGVHCTALMECPEPCPFYKSKEQYKKERQKVQERLKGLKYV